MLSRRTRSGRAVSARFNWAIVVTSTSTFTSKGARARASRSASAGSPPNCRDVVVLDEDAVRKAATMVGTSSVAYRGFGKSAHARRGLPGVEDNEGAPFQRGYRRRRRGRDAARALEDVQRRALGDQNCRELSCHPSNDGAGAYPLPIFRSEAHLDRRVDAVERAAKSFEARHHERLLGDERRFAKPPSRHERFGSEVAERAEIFREAQSMSRSRSASFTFGLGSCEESSLACAWRFASSLWVSSQKNEAAPRG